MAKTDWGLNDVVKPTDLNEIGEGINQLRQDVDNMDFPLSDATDGTRSNVAGSEKAVGLVMQAATAAQAKADQAFQLGNERKQEIVDALIALGVTASTSDSWDTLISKMSAIIKATGNATAADVLEGKTFSNANGNGLQGAMPDRGAISITPSAAQQSIPEGYHNGNGKVNAVPAPAYNIRVNMNQQMSIPANSNILVTNPTGIRMLTYLSYRINNTGYIGIKPDSVSSAPILQWRTYDCIFASSNPMTTIIELVTMRGVNF